MQLQFTKRGLSCLHTIKRQVQSQEQTQDIYISRTLCAMHSWHP